MPWVYVVDTDEFLLVPCFFFCLVLVFATMPITTYSNPDMESMELVKGYSLMYVPIEDLVMNSSHWLYTP